MKSLKTIQTLAKIGKVISKIIFILSIVGGVSSIVGIISLACIPEGIRIGGTTIYGLIEKSAEMNIGSMYVYMTVAAVFCAGEAVLCKFAERYFKNELAAGTPFTFEGAKELLRLGILTICIPIGTAIIAGIVYAVMSLSFNVVGDMNLSNGASVGMGIAFIIVSVIFRYGAELTQGAQPSANNE